jgi:hypothetical protein
MPLVVLFRYREMTYRIIKTVGSAMNREATSIVSPLLSSARYSGVRGGSASMVKGGCTVHKGEDGIHIEKHLRESGGGAFHDLELKLAVLM